MGNAFAAQNAKERQQLREQIRWLQEQHRLVETVPLLERLVELEPENPEAWEHLGLAILARSATIADETERCRQRVRGRSALAKAKELGSTSNLVAAMLEGIPPDGRLPGFSPHEAVQQAMEEGEAAFAQGDFDAAIEAYQRAMVLDPELYEAPLFIGDACYKKGDSAQAGVWFARAIALAPNRETAYRYWGDALLGASRLVEAREKFIEAVIAEPYNRLAWAGLLNWSQRTGVPLTHPRIESPNTLTEEKGQTKITISAGSLQANDGTASWLLYEITLAAWRTERFQKAFPDATEYRHSLQEEAEALRAVASAVKQQLAQGKIAKLDVTLENLLKLVEQDLLEPYILFARADEGIVQDYAPYRDQHRDRLREYLGRYVAPLPEGPAEPEANDFRYSWRRAVPGLAPAASRPLSTTMLPATST